jgi:hypothetical protein
MRLSGVECAAIFLLTPEKTFVIDIQPPTNNMFRSDLAGLPAARVFSQPTLPVAQKIGRKAFSSA